MDIAVGSLRGYDSCVMVCSARVVFPDGDWWLVRGVRAVGGGYFHQVMLFLFRVLCLAVVFLPMLLFIGIGAPDKIERLTWSSFGHVLSQGCLLIANPVWKTI